MTSVLIFGLANSMGLALMAIGFNFIFGISGIANFAYGAFYLFGGFVTYMLLNLLGLPYWMAALVALVILFIVGMLTYQLGIRRVRGAMLSEVIVTIGIGIALIELLRWTGLVGYHANLPSFALGGLTIGDVGIEYQRIFIVGIGLVLFLLFWLVTRYTKIGLAFRAMSQDELTALSLGLNNDRLAMLAMGVGTVMSVVAALSIIPLGFLSINLGYDVLIFAVAVGILGGLGSTPGIIIGAFVLGYAQTLTSAYVGPQWMMVVTFAIIVLVLLIKPSGILGKQKELEERV